MKIDQAEQKQGSVGQIQKGKKERKGFYLLSCSEFVCEEQIINKFLPAIVLCMWRISTRES